LLSINFDVDQNVSTDTEMYDFI